MAFLGGFNAEAIAADSEGLRCVPFSHCGNWAWTEKTEAQTAAGVRVWCSTKACEGTEGVAQTLPGVLCCYFVDRQGHKLVTFRTREDANRSLQAHRDSQRENGLKLGELDYYTVCIAEVR